jgi:hypothetical protein
MWLLFLLSIVRGDHCAKCTLFGCQPGLLLHLNGMCACVAVTLDYPRQSAVAVQLHRMRWRPLVPGKHPHGFLWVFNLSHATHSLQIGHASAQRLQLKDLPRHPLVWLDGFLYSLHPLNHGDLAM